MNRRIARVAGCACIVGGFADLAAMNVVFGPAALGTSPTATSATAELRKPTVETAAPVAPVVAAPTAGRPPAAPESASAAAARVVPAPASVVPAPDAGSASTSVGNRPSGGVLAFDRKGAAWFASERVDTEEVSTLVELAAALSKEADYDVTLEGHSDWFGPPHVNQKIALDRARWARDRLISYGVPAQRVNVRIALARPRAAGITSGPEEAANERRVDVFVYPRKR